MVTWADKLLRREIEFPLNLQTIVFFYLSSKKGSSLCCDVSPLRYTCFLCMLLCWPFSLIVFPHGFFQNTQRSEILSVSPAQERAFSWTASERVLWDIDLYLFVRVLYTNTAPKCAQLSEFSQTEPSRISRTQTKRRTWPAYQCPGAADTKSYTLGGSKQQNLILSPSGSHRTEIKVSVGLVLPRGSAGECPGCLSPRFWRHLQSLVMLDCLGWHIISLPLSSHGFLPCVSFLLLIKNISHMGLRVHSGDWP